MNDGTHKPVSLSAMWRTCFDKSANSTGDELELSLTCRCGAITVWCWRFEPGSFGELDLVALGLMSVAQVADGHLVKAPHLRGSASGLPMISSENSTGKSKKRSG